MKSKIHAGVVGMAGILVFVGLATAGEILAFEVLHENPQAAVRAFAETPPEPGIPESPRSAEDKNDGLPTMKEQLKDMPAEARAEFLEGMLFLDGDVVSLYTAPLKRSVSKERMIEVVESFEPSPDTKARTPKKERSFSPLIKASELLKDVPSDVRLEFLERMVVKDGSIVSMYIGGLKKTLPGPRMVEIVNALKSPAKSGANPKVLCGNGECYEAICSGKPGNRYCIDLKDYTCNSSCYSLQ